MTLEVEGPAPVLPVAGVFPAPETAGVDTPGAEGGRPAPTPAWANQAFRQRLGCPLPLRRLQKVKNMRWRPRENQPLPACSVATMCGWCSEAGTELWAYATLALAGAGASLTALSKP